MCKMCNECGLTCCSSRCPNYSSPKAEHYCSICEEGIYDGDKYIENDEGDFVHYECIGTLRELLKFLGYDIKTMNDYE